MINCYLFYLKCFVFVFFFDLVRGKENKEKIGNYF